MDDERIEMLIQIARGHAGKLRDTVGVSIWEVCDEVERLRAQVEDLRMHAEQDACEIERLCVDVLALVNAVHFLLAGRAPTEDLAEVLARCEEVGRGDALGRLVALSEDAGLYAAQEADRG